MELLDRLAKSQSTLAKQIKGLCDSYNALAEERKNVKLVQDRLERLETHWTMFEANDNEIRNKFAERVDHLYFSEDLYSQVRDLVNNFRDELLQKMANFPAENNERGNEATPVEDNREEDTAVATGQEFNPGDFMLPTNQGSPQDLLLNDTHSVLILIRKAAARRAAISALLSSINFNDQPQEYFEMKLERLMSNWKEFDNLHQEICGLCGDPARYGYAEGEFFEFDERVQEGIIRLKHHVKRAGSEPASNQSVAAAAPMSNSALKLPPITIPVFDGDYIKWPQFKDLFLRMTQKHSLSDAEKMWYLQSHLSGEPDKLIRHLIVSDNNYSVAWKILSDRYNNERLLVSSVLDKLVNQPSVVPDSAKSLRNFHDTIQESVLMLQNFGIEVSAWDPMLLYLMAKKLDKDTLTQYEQSLKSPRELQKLSEFLSFIELRFQSLEALAGSKSNSKALVQKVNRSSVMVTSQKNSRCMLCNKQHPVYVCEKFHSATPEERASTIQKLQLCFNCFRKGHSAKTCYSRGCRKCDKKHHTLLHSSKASERQMSQNTVTTLAQQPSQSTAHCSMPLDNGNHKGYVFLGTAVIYIEDKSGKLLPCRALLDPGSQSNFVSERLQRRLKLDSQHDQLHIGGIGNLKLSTRDRVNIKLLSSVSNFSAQLDAYIIKEITSDQPQQFFDISTWPIPDRLVLADPRFNQPQKIDVLIGAELYADIMRQGQIKLGQNLPMLQNTTFGWVVFGKAVADVVERPFVGITNKELDNKLQKFWEMNELKEVSLKSPAEIQCENFFKATTMRSGSGRFIVNLPILTDVSILGESMDMALRRFINMEKKLLKSPGLAKQYNEFLEEYLSSGHMREIQVSEIPDVHYFLPHHYVLKPDSTTTKLRVVFDASAKTSSNLSLNDIMLAGPKVQDDLFKILLRFRTYKYVMTADIAQMYRQIWVAEEDRNLQLIMWRKKPGEKIQYFQLCTVTYGTKAAPYLATRCLKQLAEEENGRYPLGAKAINDFYVDDVITGCHSLTEAVQLQKQLIAMLKSGGFRLRKWGANHSELLKNIEDSDKEEMKTFSSGDSGYIKTLGLHWQPATDTFAISSSLPLESDAKITKRIVVSEAAQLYDPLGLVNPVIVSAKIFIQQLWKEKYDWDDELPQNLQNQWRRFRQELNCLNRLKIRRFLFSTNQIVRSEIHAFADASKLAYGAAVYVRSIDTTNNISCKLLCAKSRVAPVKVITTPRLELCAAHLAAELVHQVLPVITTKVDKVYLWSDSEVTLSWIQGDPSSLNTFVANRVANILEHSKAEQWNYIKTSLNPADLVSRGMSPEQLIDSELWFCGPPFLRNPESTWPERTISYLRVEEAKREIVPIEVTSNVASNMSKSSNWISKIDHKNSFSFLQRVVAYVIRIIKVIRKQIKLDLNQPFRSHELRQALNEFAKGSKKKLSTFELQDALMVIVHQVQQAEFKEEIKLLKKGEQLKMNNRLLDLAPFIDENGILRVGGRLDAAAISYDAKYPILLPRNNAVSRLIMSHLHTQNLHAGAQALQAFSRQRFWILGARDLARTVVINCVKCARVKPRLGKQLMGSLPEHRVLPARPFTKTGVDFAGPIWTHYHIRGKKPQKTYIAVFCCFVTKAIHMEVVSDLSTDGFLGALKRFMARRGYCTDIFCDNATNFVGAKNRLEEIYAILTSADTQNNIIKDCSGKGVQFHFSPPRSPHFGGLWEAAVKSAKRLLRLSLASASLTYEELCTVVAEAEAILNSRPMTPLSSDPNDFSALTPGHFLIGEALTSIPDPNVSYSNPTTLTRWKLVSYLRQELWKRWKLEYLNTLQKRHKWTKSSPNVVPGMMVIIKDEQSPPLKWPLGRITEVIKGKDGYVRVVKVRSVSGEYTRAIHNLAPLPIESEESNEDVARSSSVTKRTAQADKPQRSYKKPKHLLSTVLLGMFACMVMHPANGIPDTLSIHPYEVSTVPYNSGLYFEKLGSSKLIVDEWKLIIFYNMTNYWHTFYTIQKGINKMHQIIKKIPDGEYQKTIVSQYDHLLQELEDRNEMMTMNTSTQASRIKRGIINLVGNIANKLFGVLDDEYAAHVDDTIAKVKANEDHLLQLIKNQTLIIEATNNLMKRTQKDRLNQFQTIQTEVNTVMENVKNMNEAMMVDKLNHSLMMLGLLLSLVITEFQRVQTTLLDIVTDVHHGRFNMDLLPRDQFYHHMEIIKRQLPVELQLPPVTQLYKMLTVQGKVSRQNSVFIVRLPLISTTEFDIFKLHAFPTYVDKSFVQIQPSTDFLLTSQYRDQAFALKEHEFSSCASIEPHEYYCHLDHPIHFNMSPKVRCELKMMMQHTLDNHCILKFSSPKKTWIKLQTPNTWLFTLDKPAVYNIICNGQPSQVKLNGNGILKLSETCVVRDDDIMIRSYKTMKPCVIETFFPSFNLSDEFNATLVEPLFKLPELQRPELKMTYTTEFGILRENLQNIKIQETKGLYDLSIHDKHQYIVSYSAMGLGLIILGIFIPYLITNRNRIYQIARRQQPPPRTVVSTSSIDLRPEDFRIDVQQAHINAGENV